jgi:hypothetical protein
MSVQNSNTAGPIYSGWAEILAHHFGQKTGQIAPSGADALSFQQEIGRLQGASDPGGADAPAAGPTAAELAASPDSGPSGGAVPAVVHQLRPIYFGQPEMAKEESDALGRAAIEALSAALSSRGIDPSRVRMNYVAHYFNSPAGGIPTRMIRVETPDGQWEEFSADWTLLKPHVTACDIAGRLLGGSSSQALT